MLNLSFLLLIRSVPYILLLLTTLLLLFIVRSLKSDRTLLLTTCTP
jgi:hypothetical protein